MTRFLVRIELHDASRDEYQDLYEKLAVHGFVDEIISENGKWQLPPAEYLYEGESTTKQVWKIANTVAHEVVKKCAVFVVRSAGITFSGLDPLK